MSKKKPYTKQLEDYFDGDLLPEYVKQFEKEIQEDQELKDEVALTSKVIRTLRGLAFKEMLVKIHRENFGTPEDPTNIPTP